LKIYADTVHAETSPENGCSGRFVAVQTDHAEQAFLSSAETAR